MGMVLVIGVLTVVAGSAVVLVVSRLKRAEEERAAAEKEVQRKAEEEKARLRAEEERAALEKEVQRKAEEEKARLQAEEEQAAAEKEVQRKAEEEKARLRAEEERAAAENEVQRKAEEEKARLRAEEERAAAEKEVQRKAEEEKARLQAEVEQAAAEKEVQRKAEEEKARLQAEVEQAAAEKEVQRKAEEEKARLQAEEEQAAVEKEVQRKTEEEKARLRAEEERAAAEKEVQRKAEEEKARLRAEEERAAAEKEVQRKTEEEKARLRAEEERAAAEQQAAIEFEDGRNPPAADEDPQTTVAPTSAAGSEANASRGAVSPRAPHQYRPVPRVRPAQLECEPASTERTTRERALPIEVRLVFEQAGFCRISLLPRRAAGLPVKLSVAGSGEPPELLALQDEWYQDVFLANPNRLLEEGIEWVGVLPDGGQARWSLGGRELFVLARHRDLSGFVTTSRLVLGEEHVVLCVAGRLSDVRAAIDKTGSPEPALLSSDSGVPAGWVGLRGVVPRIPIAPGPIANILGALCPLAEVDVALDGGIRIDRQTWLSGFPPRIRLRGDASAVLTVVIDGHDATLGPEGGYVAPGWDDPGDHSIWCTSGSRTYTIRGGAESWEPWDAYTWSLGESGGEAKELRPAICGVLVRVPGAARTGSHTVVVPASTPVLIGAVPGEIELCMRRSDVRAGLCVGFPWFEPVWAMPANALHCDRRSARILLIGAPLVVRPISLHPTPRAKGRHLRGPDRRLFEWCAAIRTAANKGLQVEPPEAGLQELWQKYKRQARTLLRRM